ncbi:ADP-ribose pyrophosphatase YjhB, NUDIX family [Quadrisphaera granulorum]|uniref:ADP-ribose pyrophosphatase YjhB (NUDIX family) n=1 Tax=Quadrisphaera granulorum TaxID=317664 RepID=A0A316AYT5_9ACTN|nr:NUDIX domain-containing protein [Quadrisphaera granulorum]PWJ55387.1 ADP-ribose pyrophosphatase YjhB (NUDIX family) [Quadrisphaera granulorum]SZE95451.1 ADP-ribose pyrophosphatase YjhB, NUDIX family [Quadrisphaera granulorum]
MDDGRHAQGPLAMLLARVPPELRGRAHTALLRAFRVTPAPMRRALVRAGTPSFTVGAVCAVEHEGSVLFLRQPHRGGWSLPGGLLDRGEAPAPGVEREVREETGLRVSVGAPVTALVEPRVRRVDIVYRVVVAQRPEVVPGGEARDFAWLTPEEAGHDADSATRSILAGLTAALADGARDGRLLP